METVWRTRRSTYTLPPIYTVRMQSFISRGVSLFTPSPSPSQSKPSTPNPPTKRTVCSAEDFIKAPLPEALFSKTDPATDGEECEHDCATCTIRYPAKFEVDQEDELYGHVNGWATHVLVATGKTDWVRDVADEEGSVMEAVEKGGVLPGNGVSCSSSVSVLSPCYSMFVLRSSDVVRRYC